MLAARLKRVGLTVAVHKQQAVDFAGPFTRALADRGVEVLLADGQVPLPVPPGARLVSIAECVATDLVIALGGDGTLLHAARAAAPQGTPLLGVDLGSFGFLAAEDPDYLMAHLDDLLGQRFEVESRMLLAARVVDEAETGCEWLLACNDVVVSRGLMARLVRLHTTLDSTHIATFPADGLIVATATGSTAYNISAGGPILDPRMPAMVLTPICPHTLYSRPLVVPGTVEVGLVLDDRGMGEEQALVTVDGQDTLSLSGRQRLVIRRAPCDARLVRLRPLEFYERLREKLRWGMER